MGQAAPRLIDHVPLGAALADPAASLDRFLAWVEASGITPYAAQEDALLELAAGRHVVLQTPTGSGKSLVALGLHFQALCAGRRSYYTAPIKALVNEKFFALCDAFGAENVGMLTGDASINWAAPIVCCTQEILANMALRQGARADAPYVVMDEFHYYGDRDRGHAWQVPLLTLADTTFLLMSATLGNTAPIEERLQAFTARECAHVFDDHRPVPLDFGYRDSAIHETVEALLEEGRAPVYIVNFTQRDAAETAGALTSAQLTTREQRVAIRDAIATTRFDSPYGKEIRRMISHGVGVHHAGLLPRYRLLVERLAQQGLLRVISGTDTLGVGVNVPIRTVLFSRLTKYDGEKVRVLSVREFRQISGRAGRRGFDERGSVVCQAPEHVIQNRRAAAKDTRGRRPAKKRPPPQGFVAWNEETFRQLSERPCEPLESRFRVTHGMMLQLLQREPELVGPRGGYGVLADLIARSHERPARKPRLLREAAVLFRALRRAGIVRVADHAVAVDPELQRDFSLHGTLSLYAVEAVAALDPEAPEHAGQVLSVVEAVIEDPRIILLQQRKKLRDALMAELKAERVPYEERIEKLEEVTWPQPEANFLRETFRVFAAEHPWVSDHDVRPKSIAREMVAGYEGFDAAVSRWGLQRSEGVLLRYLSQVQRTLEQTVPDAAKTEALWDASAYLRALLARADASLEEAWTAQLGGPAPTAGEEEPTPRRSLASDPKAFAAQVRAELHAIVRALAAGDYAEAAALGRPGDEACDAAELEAALAPFLEENGRVRFDGEARRAHLTSLERGDPQHWSFLHGLLDANGDATWALLGRIDLSQDENPPLVQITGIRE